MKTNWLRLNYIQQLLYCKDTSPISLPQFSCSWDHVMYVISVLKAWQIDQVSRVQNNEFAFHILKPCRRGGLVSLWLKRHYIFCTSVNTALWHSNNDCRDTRVVTKLTCSKKSKFCSRVSVSKYCTSMSVIAIWYLMTQRN